MMKEAQAFTGIDEAALTSLRDALATQMSEKRYKHTLAVERMAIRLGELYCPEHIPHLRAAALLHDITKEETFEKQLQLCQKFGIIVSETDRLSPKTFHAKTAAALIPEKYPQLAHPTVISAVRWHTTGHADMTICENLIYLADYIDDTRRFDDCVELRKYFYDGLSKAKDQKDRYVCLLKTLMLSFDMTVSSLKNEGAPVDTDTLEARDYIRKELEKYTG
jgi:nicotinate-nucleotide adenylyltransferase